MTLGRVPVRVGFAVGTAVCVLLLAALLVSSHPPAACYSTITGPEAHFVRNRVIHGTCIRLGTAAAAGLSMWLAAVVAAAGCSIRSTEDGTPPSSTD